MDTTETTRYRRRAMDRLKIRMWHWCQRNQRCHWGWKDAQGEWPEMCKLIESLLPGFRADHVKALLD